MNEFYDSSLRAPQVKTPSFANFQLGRAKISEARAILYFKTHKVNNFFPKIFEQPFFYPKKRIFLA